MRRKTAAGELLEDDELRKLERSRSSRRPKPTRRGGARRTRRGPARNASPSRGSLVLLTNLCGSAFVADLATELALVGRVEPDRDQHGSARRRRLHQFGVPERRAAPRSPIAARASAFAARSAAPVGSFPAAALGVETLAVVAPDPVVDGPAVLLESAVMSRVSTTSAIGGTVPDLEATPRRPGSPGSRDVRRGLLMLSRLAGRSP